MTTGKTGAYASKRSRGKDSRHRQLGRIHILKAQLGLDDESYRNVLWVHGRVDSSADLDQHGRHAVIKHMESHLPQGQRGVPREPHNLSAKDRGELEKIQALLTDAGQPWAYAEAILRNQTRGRITRMAFASGNQLVGVVAALHRQAIKRLSVELEKEFGEVWDLAGAEIAMWLFDLPEKRTFEKYPEMMSKVLRWQRGQLQAFCTWPAAHPCCVGCIQRSIAPRENQEDLGGNCG